MSEIRFGTDGIRGRAGTAPMDIETVTRLGLALGAWAQTSAVRPQVVVGRDPRLSGDAFEAAITAGLCAAGCDVVSLGVAPTPAVAYATLSRAASAGVVISASHNPFTDNGVKIFAADGFKLPEADEAALEVALAEPARPGGAPAASWGRASVGGDLKAYGDMVLGALGGLRLDGMKVVVDAAHGAASELAPELFELAGAQVVRSGCAPDGLNINDGVGALHPETVAALVREHGADLGVALDGDADRCILVDETGEVRDGDPILGIWARELKARGALPHHTVVATVMSNLGLEEWLKSMGVHLLRTPVGDKYVAREMRAGGYVLGGEQSGHLLDLSRTTTGDGLLTAMSVARIMAAAGLPLSSLCRGFSRYPQILHNVWVRERAPIEAIHGLHAAITQAEAELGPHGRVLVRYSGTELKARVMIEGAEPAHIVALAHGIGEVIAAAIGA